MYLRDDSISLSHTDDRNRIEKIQKLGLFQLRSRNSTSEVLSSNPLQKVICYKHQWRTREANKM